MTDQLLGAALLTVTGLVFTYYTLWVIVMLHLLIFSSVHVPVTAGTAIGEANKNIMPFVDEDQVYIHALFPDRKFAVALPLLAGVLGLAVIGGFVAVVLLTSRSKEKSS